jgi:H+-transporting ATPase
VAALVEAADEEFGLKGYKTIGIAVAEGDGEWVFAGIVPMLDPPRHDTMETIHKIKSAGVRVKMITGDHTNIAKETARLIGLGQNILPHTELEIPSAVRDATIEVS